MNNATSIRSIRKTRNICCLIFQNLLKLEIEIMCTTNFLHLFTKAKKSVIEAFLRPNTKLIRFRNPHPSHRSDIAFINFNDLSSSLLLPRQAS